ncbi:MAG: DUF2268 domain-containing putative Zn-dependent protease [bacterium]|nr:DUF2268 domain-containing putative Zn-dependent protease [bacterium]
MKRDKSKIIQIKGVELADVYYVTDCIYPAPAYNPELRLKWLYDLLSKAPNSLPRRKLVLEHSGAILNLYKYIFSNEKATTRRRLMDKNEIAKQIKKTFIKCKFEIPTRKTVIVVYPRFEKKKPVTGSVLVSNTLELFINTTKPWKRDLEDVVAHEYFHVAYQGNFRTKDFFNPVVAEVMIDEGMAAYFSEKVVGYKEKKYEQMSSSRAKKLLKEIQHILHFKNNKKMVTELNAGYGAYPENTLHILGYHLAKAFVDDMPDMSWEAIAQIRPRTLFRLSWMVLMGNDPPEKL